MRNLIILSSYVMFVSSSPVTYNFSPTIDGLSNAKTNTNSVECKRSLKTANRHRRSIWTEIIDHIAAAAETFHMKPALAEGIAEANDFNKQFKNKLRDGPKSVNAMLKEEAKDDETFTEVGESFSGDSKKSKKDSLSSVEIENEKRKREGQLTLEEEKTLLQEVERIVESHEEVNKVEFEMIEKMVHFDWEDISKSDERYLLKEYKKVDSLRAERILFIVVERYPYFKCFLAQNLKKIKEMRETLVRRHAVLDKLILKQRTNWNCKKALELERRNLQWLEHKMNPDFEKWMSDPELLKEEFKLNEPDRS